MAKRRRDRRLIEERQRAKGAENADEPGRRGRDRCRLGDGEPCPGVEKRGQRPVGVADVDVFAAGLRLHGAKLGVGHGAKHREQAADDPDEIDEACRADRLHHLGGNEKDAAADDGADDDRGRVAGAEIAGESGPRLVSSSRSKACCSVMRTPERIPECGGCPGRTRMRCGAFTTFAAKSASFQYAAQVEASKLGC